MRINWKRYEKQIENLLTIRPNAPWEYLCTYFGASGQACLMTIERMIGEGKLTVETRDGKNYYSLAK